MAETKVKNPAAQLFKASWIATSASAVLFFLFWAVGLFSCAGCSNAVTMGFARMFGVIGGFFGAGTTSGGIPVLGMAGIGVGLVGIVVFVAFLVTFKKHNDKYGMIGSAVWLGATAILAIMLVAFDAARYYGNPARKFYGSLVLVGGPAAVAFIAATIFLLIHYIIDCIDLTDCVVMVAAPAPAAVTVKEEEEPEVVEEKAEEEPVVEEKAEEKVEEEVVADDADEESEDEDGETEEVEEQVVQPDGSVITIKRRRHACFETKLKKSDEDLRHKYYDLRDYIKSYGIKNRISRPGDTFSAHREKYVFITIVGKHIRAYFALNADDYADSPIPVEKATAKKYEGVECLLKVRSDLSFRRAKKLVDDVMKAKGVEKPESK